MVERLVSNSGLKEKLFRAVGIPTYQDTVLRKRLEEVEERFYKEGAVEVSRASGIIRVDGLIFPYNVGSKDTFLPLPVAVTIVKAAELRSAVDEDPELKRECNGLFVNDAVWAVGNNINDIESAINKTDPTRNHGDVERLADFFTTTHGKTLYSVGSTGRLDVQTGVIDVSLGILTVGRIKDHTREDFMTIFGNPLRERRGFNLDFVLHESLLDLRDRFLVTQQKVVVSNEGIDFKTSRSWFEDYIPENLTVLQLASHGVPYGSI